jgi:uncharacterized metal-binding protein
MTQTPPLPPAAPAIPPKPGYVQAIAIMCLVDGILSILGGIGGVLIPLCGLMVPCVGLVTLCCVPTLLYAVVLGVLEIVYAAQVLPDPIRGVRPAKYLAIMQIVNIINGDVVSLTVGILSLVFYNDAQVKEYFRAVECRRVCR